MSDLVAVVSRPNVLANMSAPLRFAISAGITLTRINATECRCICVWTRQLCLATSSLRLDPPSHRIDSVRHYPSFINSLTADHLWSGVVGVSNAGKKRGRGKRVGRKKITDLNKGQMLGQGRANMMWPGLNTPVVRGREVIQRQQLPPDPDRESKLAQMRDRMGRIRYRSVPPLLRGWSGPRFPGQSMGSPDPVQDYEFENFDSRVLQFRLVTNMTGTLGRKQRFGAFVVVGNKNGLAGYGTGKSQVGKSAIKLAKNRAAQKLCYIPRFEDHTVYHNMFSKYHRSKIFIHKKEKGYGLHCHRAIKTICELMGIKDLHCKVEGSTKNVQTIAKGFFNALMHQETHQELADRTRYHVVEFREERDQLPVIKASPSGVEVMQQDYQDEDEDLEMSFDRLYYGGKMELKKPERKPFYYNYDSHRKKRRRMHLMRNQPEAKVLRDCNLW